MSLRNNLLSFKRLLKTTKWIFFHPGLGTNGLILTQRPKGKLTLFDFHHKLTYILKEKQRFYCHMSHPWSSLVAIYQEKYSTHICQLHIIALPVNFRFSRLKSCHSKKDFNSWLSKNKFNNKNLCKIKLEFSRYLNVHLPLKNMFFSHFYTEMCVYYNISKVVRSYP